MCWFQVSNFKLLREPFSTRVIQSHPPSTGLTPGSMTKDHSWLASGNTGGAGNLMWTDACKANILIQCILSGPLNFLTLEAGDASPELGWEFTNRQGWFREQHLTPLCSQACICTAPSFADTNAAEHLGQIQDCICIESQQLYRALILHVVDPGLITWNYIQFPEPHQEWSLNSAREKP